MSETRFKPWNYYVAQDIRLTSYEVERLWAAGKSNIDIHVARRKAAYIANKAIKNMMES